MQVTIDRFEGEQVVIILPEAQKIIINKNDLPAGAKEGDVLDLVFVSDQIKTLNHEEQAKAILNEILKTDV